MSRSDNKLTIQTRGLRLDLEGDSAQVRRTYSTLRTQLIEQFYQTMIGKRGRADRTLELETIDRSAGPETPQPPQDVEKQPENFVGLVICEDIYHKMYLLDEERFHESALSKVLRGEQVRRIYVDAALEEQLRGSIKLGSTLWRELTSAGKAAVARSD